MAPLFSKKKENIPLLIVREIVVFPDTIIGLSFGRDKSIQALQSLSSGSKLMIVTQKDPETDDPQPEDFYQIGTVGVLRQVMEIGQEYRILFQGTERAKIANYAQNKPFYKIEYEVIENEEKTDEVTIALRNTLINSLKKLVNLDRVFPLEAITKIFSTNEPNQLVNNIIPFLDAKPENKQEILESTDVNQRLEQANKLVNQTLKIAELEQQMANKTQEELSKIQKEIFLREEMKTIQKELGEVSEDEYDELKKKIDLARMPTNIHNVAIKELTRLKKMPSFSPEVSYIRGYLDWLIDLPWRVDDKNNIDIRESKKILDNDHYGLKKVKERILEYLAVQKLVGKIRGPILCFVGPPGTGKTSIGQSIAKALNRQFTRISLGGIHDEAEIRGHRRTYVGAMPGRIIQGIKQAKTKNPVFMLDEIDKIGADFRGDPSAALLEALDPEQNSKFSDHYLEVPYDLSDVLFITTANILDPIPPALRDRMEIIEFPGYSADEKMHIAKGFILPKVLQSHGLTEKQFNLSDSTLNKIIENYTQEAGVRNLEREISNLARKIALRATENLTIPKSISKETLGELLGPPKIERWIAEVESQIGLVAALAVTEAGGEVLSVEAIFMPGGKGNLILTGHLGDVMKESAQAALSYARSISLKYQIDPDIFKENDIHIHVPSGAIPKDGPSAGGAMALAIISAMTKKPFDKEIGITGELTLRGRLLRIGGVREKVLAAHRAGLTKVILPESNKADLSELPEEISKSLEFIFTKSLHEVLPHIFS